MADCNNCSRLYLKFGHSLIKFLRTGTEMQRSFAVMFHGHSLVVWVTTVSAVVVLLTALALPWLQIPLPFDRRTNAAEGSFHRHNSRGIIAKRNGPNHISNLFSSSPVYDLTPTLFSANSDAPSGPEGSLISTFYLKTKDRATSGTLTSFNRKTKQIILIVLLNVCHMSAFIFEFRGNTSLLVMIKYWI